MIRAAAARGVARAPRGGVAAGAAALALLAACANIGPPPGGPPDTTPPTLVSVFPESLAVLPGFKGSVEFRFDEVVSEGTSPSQGLGTGDLEKLIILSPSDRVPDIGWHRRRITVRPAEGWRPGRVYRVELLPGIADVRQNKSRIEAIVTFTTGAPLPHDTLTGRIFDWKTGSPAPTGLVEAVLQPDSLVYRALADSAGRFSFGPLPQGEYLVYGVVDNNKNNRLDLREPFDSVRVRPESAVVAVPELYAFAHDTLPPRLTEARPIDSVSATLTFAQSLDPFQRLDSTAVTVRKLPDSTAVPVVGLVQRDTAGPAARPADTTAAAAARAMSRPPLSDHLTLKVGEPWHPGDRFVVDLSGIRTLSGVSGDTRGLLAIPEAKPAAGAPGAPADTTGTDSLKARADSLRADSLKADSLKSRPPEKPR